MDKLTSSREAYDEFLLLKSNRPEREPLEKLEGALKLLNISEALLIQEMNTLLDQGLKQINGMTFDDITTVLENVQSEIQIYTACLGRHFQEYVDEDAAYAAQLQAEEETRQPPVSWENRVSRPVDLRAKDLHATPSHNGIDKNDPVTKKSSV